MLHLAIAPYLLRVACSHLRWCASLAMGKRGGGKGTGPENEGRIMEMPHVNGVCAMGPLVLSHRGFP